MVLVGWSLVARGQSARKGWVVRAVLYAGQMVKRPDIQEPQGAAVARHLADRTQVRVRGQFNHSACMKIGKFIIAKTYHFLYSCFIFLSHCNQYSAVGM